MNMLVSECMSSLLLLSIYSIHTLSVCPMVHGLLGGDVSFLFGVATCAGRKQKYLFVKTVNNIINNL